MFTGLVQEVGEVVGRERLGRGLALTLRAPGTAEAVREGESVAVDGVCQTVTAAEGTTLSFESVRETLSRTTLGDLEPGRRVNLERAVAAGERLGGHFVQGHVDGTARVVRVERVEESVYLEVELPPEAARTTVDGGSLALDGVSLTVQELRDPVAEVAIVPYTWTHTALDRLASGDRVNVEADLIGKYVSRLLAPYGEDRRSGTDDERERDPAGPR